MQTSVRVSAVNRDGLAQVAQQVGGSMDEAVRVLLFEHASLAAIARLEANPRMLTDYQDEAHNWAELDTAVDQ